MHSYNKLTHPNVDTQELTAGLEGDGSSQSSSGFFAVLDGRLEARGFFIVPALSADDARGFDGALGAGNLLSAFCSYFTQPLN
jgi:hypothetical protein